MTIVKLYWEGIGNNQGNGEDVAPLRMILDINERLVSQQSCFTGCHSPEMEVLIEASKCVVWFQSLEAVRPALHSRELFRYFQTVCLMRGEVC